MDTFEKIIKEYKATIKREVKIANQFPQARLEYQDGLIDGLQFGINLLEKYKEVFKFYDNEVKDGEVN